MGFAAPKAAESGVFLVRRAGQNLQAASISAGRKAAFRLARCLRKDGHDRLDARLAKFATRGIPHEAMVARG